MCPQFRPQESVELGVRKLQKLLDLELCEIWSNYKQVPSFSVPLLSLPGVSFFKKTLSSIILMLSYFDVWKRIDHPSGNKLPFKYFILTFLSVCKCRHFVPNLTIGAPVIQSLRKHTKYSLLILCYMDGFLFCIVPVVLTVGF